MFYVIFDGRSSENQEEEVRISAADDKTQETSRLENEAEDELVENSGSFIPGSTSVDEKTSSNESIEKVVSQNREIISLLEEIKSEVKDDNEEPERGAPADQLL